MASITIRKIDEGVKQALRLQAARKGHSMEEEARAILALSVRGETAAQPKRTMADVMERVNALVDQAEGFDIVIEKDKPVDFSIYEVMHAPGSSAKAGKIP
jgi:plasmid stability protein